MADVIRPCTDRDLEVIFEVISDAAQAYKGVIPEDRFNDPYMSREELQAEIGHGVRFWGFEQDARLLGVMGLQDVEDVTLIRHAYVRSTHRRRGIGGRLLNDLRSKATRPLLVGTWAAAVWAIEFYRQHGFEIGRARGGATPLAPLLVGARAPDRDVRRAGREGVARSRPDTDPAIFPTHPACKICGYVIHPAAW